MSRTGTAMPPGRPPSLNRLARYAGSGPVGSVLRTMAGRGALIAGGSVRDALLGRPCLDLDLSVEGSVEEVGEAARRVGALLDARPHLVGRPPRSVWRVDGTTLKVELWPLGGLSVVEDAWRRDLTVNAMLWSAPDGPLVDPTGGLADLRARRLRATSRQALADDPVRLLRSVRFLAALPGFALETPTAGWIRELAPLLAGSPRERVGHELLLLSRAARPELGLSALLELDLLAPSAPPHASPEPGRLRRSLPAVRRLAAPRLHPVPAAARSAGANAILALLLRSLDGVDEASAYAWDRGLRLATVAAASHVARVGSAVGAPAAVRRELIHRLGEAFPAALAAAAALDASSGATARWRRWWRLWRRRGLELTAPTPLVGAEAVRTVAGEVSGPELGRLLRAALAAQVRGEVRSVGGALRLVRRLAGEGPEPAPPVC